MEIFKTKHYEDYYFLMNTLKNNNKGCEFVFCMLSVYQSVYLKVYIIMFYF